MVYVVEAYRLDRYDNINLLEVMLLLAPVVEAYRLDRYDNQSRSLSIFATK